MFIQIPKLMTPKISILEYIYPRKTAGSLFTDRLLFLYRTIHINESVFIVTFGNT